MEQCPRCSAFMTFHMAYSCGSPHIYYVCPVCRFDTRTGYEITVSSTTVPVDSYKYSSFSTFTKSGG